MGETRDMNKEEFIDFMLDMMKKYDFCDTQAE